MFDWIIAAIAQHGYLGIALLMFAENVFPPIPSELIMPFAGFVATRGQLDPLGVVAAGVAGSLAGALPWYWAGRLLGCDRLQRLAERHGRWLTVSADDVARARGWFDRHGAAAVLLGRLVPAVRSVISAPAGMVRMPLPRFVLWSAAGTLVWSAALTSLGWLLESQYARVADWLDPVSKAILAAIVLSYAYRVATWPQRTRRRPEKDAPKA